MSKAISQRFLRLPEVKHLTGLSKATIYAPISVDAFLGRFPWVLAQWFGWNLISKNGSKNK
jgi:hypothetical protein